MLGKIEEFVRKLNVEANDWMHMAWGLWLFIITSMWFGVNMWWVGIVSGLVAETCQFLFGGSSKYKLKWRDRLADAWGHSVTVTMLLAPSWWWLIIAGLLWYLALWAQRAMLRGLWGKQLKVS